MGCLLWVMDDGEYLALQKEFYVTWITYSLFTITYNLYLISHR